MPCVRCISVSTAHLENCVIKRDRVVPRPQPIERKYRDPIPNPVRDTGWASCEQDPPTGRRAAKRGPDYVAYPEISTMGSLQCWGDFLASMRVICIFGGGEGRACVRVGRRRPSRNRKGERRRAGWSPESTAHHRIILPSQAKKKKSCRDKEYPSLAKQKWFSSLAPEIRQPRVPVGVLSVWLIRRTCVISPGSVLTLTRP